MDTSNNDADRHIIIRPATSDDIGEVRNLLVATWHDTYDSLLGVERVTETTKALIGFRGGEAGTGKRG